MLQRKQTAARIITEMVTRACDSRRNLESGLGMSKATISRTVDQLLDLGFISEGAKQEPETRGPGRKAVQLDVRADLGCLIGTDLEGRAMRACVLDCARNVLASGKTDGGAVMVH